MSAATRALAFVAAALLHVAAAHAGTACRRESATPAALDAAASSALAVATELRGRDAPVALVARVGTDLSKYGLRYSHLGFAVREHRDGEWTVVHELNRCGTDRSGIFAEGLVNFFVDDLVAQDAKIVWLEPALAARVAAALDDGRALALHDPRYNVIARTGSARDQNSTAWVLEVLAAARADLREPTRAQAHAELRATGFRSDWLAIPYSQRVLGGLFSANARFTDHPLSSRLGGRYEVVTVRSIFRWLREHGELAAEREIGAASGNDRVARAKAGDGGWATVRVSHRHPDRHWATRSIRPPTPGFACGPRRWTPACAGVTPWEHGRLADGGLMPAQAGIQ